MESLVQYIQSLHTNAEYPVFPTFDDIQDFIIDNFHNDIKDDTVRCIIEHTLGIILKQWMQNQLKSKEWKFN